LLEFDKEYPSAKTIVLEHNYRSSKTIVDASNAVIEQNQNRKEKKSITTNPEGEKIIVHAAPSAEGRRNGLPRKFARSCEEVKLPESIAILYRTNFQSRALEEGFATREYFVSLTRHTLL